jgi:ankyrin repeat protein
LISACRAANVEAASLMLQAGADARVKNKQGETALALATAGNLTALIPLLHQAGASE